MSPCSRLKKKKHINKYEATSGTQLFSNNLIKFSFNIGKVKKKLAHTYKNQNIIPPTAERDPATWDNMGDSGGHCLNEVSRAEKDEYCMVSLIRGI